MMNDPDTFHDPHTFSPERFWNDVKTRNEALGNSTNTYNGEVYKPKDDDPFEIIYGFGRR